MDRKARLAALLKNVRTNGAVAHEAEIDRFRTSHNLTEAEREILREIFCFGFDAAEKDKRQDKMWVYQRLLRRLLLHQPLDQAIPLPEFPGSGSAKPTPPMVPPAGRPDAERAAASDPSRRRTRRRHLIRYGAYLGGTAALLWVGYSNRSMIGGPELYSLAIANLQNSVTAISKAGKQILRAIPLHAEAESGKLESNRGEPDAPPKGATEKVSGIKSDAPRIENAMVATVETAGPSVPSTTPAAGGPRSSRRDAFPEEGLKNRPIYKTVRQILLRDQPRFGAAAEIMLDRGARLIILETLGPWRKVIMEETGAPGFVREEWLVPADAEAATTAVGASRDS